MGKTRKKVTGYRKQGKQGVDRKIKEQKKKGGVRQLRKGAKSTGKAPQERGRQKRRRKWKKGRKRWEVGEGDGTRRSTIGCGGEKKTKGRGPEKGKV